MKDAKVQAVVHIVSAYHPEQGEWHQAESVHMTEDGALSELARLRQANPDIDYDLASWTLYV